MVDYSLHQRALYKLSYAIELNHLPFLQVFLNASFQPTAPKKPQLPTLKFGLQHGRRQ